MTVEDRMLFAAIEARLSVAVAEVDALLDLVQRFVILHVSEGGYMSPEHQGTLRIARATLAEHGRTS